MKPRAVDTFAWRPIQAADTSATAAPDQCLRDGQQRMTSLYQTGHPGLKAGIAPEEGRDIPQDGEGFDLPHAQPEEAA